MINPIVIKCLSGFAVTSAAAGGVYAIVNVINPPKPVPATKHLSIVVHQKDAITADKTLLLDGKNTTYRCKYDAKIEQCSLIPLALTDKKTWMNIDEIEAATLADKTLSITSADNKSFFKIEVNESFFNTLKTNISTPKVISIVKWSSDTEGEVLFTADMLFTIDENKTTFFDKSTFVVKAGTISGTGTLETPKPTVCSFSSNDSVEGTPIPCSLSELGSSLDATANFGAAATTSAIDASKMYLVNFTASDQTSGLAQAAKGNKQLLFFKQTIASGQTTTNDLIAKFANVSVDPAIVITESNKKYAFILN